MQHSDVVYETSLSICPRCRRSINGWVFFRGNQVYLGMICPQDGQFEDLVYDDAELYARTFSRRNLEPATSLMPVAQQVYWAQSGHPAWAGFEQDAGLFDSGVNNSPEMSNSCTVDAGSACNVDVSSACTVDMSSAGGADFGGSCDAGSSSH